MKKFTKNFLCLINYFVIFFTSFAASLPGLSTQWSRVLTRVAQHTQRVLSNTFGIFFAKNFSQIFVDFFSGLCYTAQLAPLHPQPAQGTPLWCSCKQCKYQCCVISTTYYHCWLSLLFFSYCIISYSYCVVYLSIYLLVCMYVYCCSVVQCVVLHYYYCQYYCQCVCYLSICLLIYLSIYLSITVSVCIILYVYSIVCVYYTMCMYYTMYVQYVCVQYSTQYIACVYSIVYYSVQYSMYVCVVIMLCCCCCVYVFVCVVVVACVLCVSYCVCVSLLASVLPGRAPCLPACASPCACLAG